MIRRIVADEVEDRLDYLASEAALHEGAPIRAEEVFRKLDL